MPFRMGPWEIALIVVIILIIFGVGKLPQVGGAIGKGIRSFRKAQSGELDEEDEDEEEEEEEEEKPKPKRKTTAKKKVRK
jgi:sec-independent protein translocase protein TatA